MFAMRPSSLDIESGLHFQLHAWMFAMRPSSLDIESGLHFQLPPTTGLRPARRAIAAATAAAANAAASPRPLREVLPVNAADSPCWGRSPLLAAPDLRSAGGAALPRMTSKAAPACKSAMVSSNARNLGDTMPEVFRVNSKTSVKNDDV